MRFRLQRMCWGSYLGCTFMSGKIWTGGAGDFSPRNPASETIATEIKMKAMKK
jgi:hypothetical protein